MWIFTQYGFFSAVCARDEQGQPNPEEMMIRARDKEHLERLQERFHQLRAYQIKESPRADYRYRIIVGKPVWAEVSLELVQEIDYDNFKDKVAETYADNDNMMRYEHSLHQVWQVMFSLQHLAHRFLGAK